LPPFSQNFAASLLLESARQFAPLVDSDRLLTLGQVAKLLQVCPATVYKLCEKGELAHVRILNAIRIAPADLADLIRRRSKVLQ
jgi:excisionase family DNA binding protein